MSRSVKVIAIVLQVVVWFGWHVEAAVAQVTETYLFRDSFDPIEGAGNFAWDAIRQRPDAS